MISKNYNILLADDDLADCLLFKDALDELPVTAQLTIVHNGEQVLEELGRKGATLPDVLFLDLNMPRKNGFAALGEIKRNIGLQELPVIIFSTSSEMDTINIVYKNAAHYFICKPVDFSQLKKVIYEALTLVLLENKSMPLKENFIITGDHIIIPDSADT